MEPRDSLSDDGLAVMSLCSALALPEDNSAEVAPFTLSEWNKLAQQIQNSSLGQPAALQGRGADELATELDLGAGEAERMVRLLARSGRLALELDTFRARGIWATTRLDQSYPKRLRDTLKHQAPVVLFGAGNAGLLNRGGVAVIGSRNIDEAGAAFAGEVGRKSVAARLPVVSGGARGTDRLAMNAAIESEGIALGVLADSLERTVRQPDLGQLLIEDRLLLLTPYAPTAGFSVGAAMGRNKVIYGLAEFAVVVSSDYQTGGTWAGAVEALKAGWCPVFVRQDEEVPKGNRELLKLGAVPFPANELRSANDLAAWFHDHAQPKLIEGELFGPNR
jgi:predicted Rossmann fold nucleotide-binding protein DprA/Smf involved in DNA uptake